MSLKDRLIARVVAGGAVTYAEFMEDALYSAPFGYYTQGRNLDSADYLTAPKVHPAFGALIAVQIYEMWTILGRGEFVLVELGASDGTLSADILRFVEQNLPDFAAQLKVRAFDRFPAGENVENLFALEKVRGCVLSNELLDALPVNKFVVKADAPYEVRIGLCDGELADEVDAYPSPAIADALGADLAHLPDGYIGEVNLRLQDWTDEVAQIVSTGFVLTIDYGRYRTASHQKGSLRTYYKHVQDRTPLNLLAPQDITADVDFGALERAFAASGFELCGAVSQARFLENLGIAEWLHQIRAMDLPQRQKHANIAAILRLLADDGLGNFAVYIHSRGVEPQELHGLSGKKTAPSTKIPLLDENSQRTYIQDERGALSGYNFSGNRTE